MLSSSGKRMELEDMLSEISQTQKDKKYMFFLIQKVFFFNLIAEAGLGTLRKGEGKQMEVGRKNF